MVSGGKQERSAITMTVLAGPIAAGNSITPAVFGLVGVLIGALVAGAASLWVAKQAREAAERAWMRDNRREIYDRFLTCAQTLLIACETAWRSEAPNSFRRSETEGAGTAFGAADIKFWEAYGVVQTVADNRLVDASRVYAYRLLALERLGSTSDVGSEVFKTVAGLVRDARHNTIDAIRAELGLAGSIHREEEFNPFVGTSWEGEYARRELSRPEPAA
jgi:hypothetical protein